MNLKQWRQKEGITLTEIRDLTGVDVSLLSRYENGKLVPPPRTKLLIARKLGVRIRELFPVEAEAVSDARV